MLRAKYDAVRDEYEEAVFDEVQFLLQQFASGSTAEEFFGQSLSPLDALCAMDMFARNVKFALAEQIAVCLSRGYEHSWNEISAALGVSRQAVVKRFGPFV